VALVTRYQKIKITGSVEGQLFNTSSGRYRHYNFILDFSEFESQPNHVETKLNKLIINVPGLMSYDYLGSLYLRLSAREYINSSSGFGNLFYLSETKKSEIPSISSTGILENIGQSKAGTIPVVPSYDTEKDLQNPLSDSWEQTYEIPGGTLEYDQMLHGYGRTLRHGDQIIISLSANKNADMSPDFTIMQANDNPSREYGGNFTLNVTLEIESVISGS